MEFFLSLLNENQLALVAAIVGVLVAASNLVTMFFPSVIGHPAYDFFMKVLNALSLNVGKNKNADDK